VLYGLSFSRNAIRESDSAIIVEGYLDLIQLFQAGITNVVAVSGTALTDQQATELKKLTTNIALAYDGDDAGIQAAIRGGYTLLRNGLSPRVVEIPDKLDPDDWVLRDGPEPFLAAQKAALPILEFHKKHYSGNLSETGDMRKFLDEALRELSQISDGLVRDLNLHQLADLTGVDEKRLKETLKRLPEQRRRSAQANGKGTEAASFESTKSNKAQLVLVRLAFCENELVLNLIADQGTADLFTHEGLAELWKRILNMLNDGTVPDSTALMLSLESDAARELLSKALMQPTSDDEAVSLAIDCLRVLHSDRIKGQIDRLRGELRQLEKSGTQPADDTMAKIGNLRSELVALDKIFEGYLIT
jgi:DNA primase